MSLKQKLRFVILISLLVVAASAAAGLYAVNRAYRRALYRAVSQALVSSSARVGERLDEMHTVADMILASDAVQVELKALSEAESAGVISENAVEGLSDAKRHAQEEIIYNAISALYFNFEKPYLSGIRLLSSGTDLSISFTGTRRTLSYDKEHFETLAREAGGSCRWITDYAAEGFVYLVRELREAKNLSMRHIGTLILCVDAEKLFSSSLPDASGYGDISYLIYDNTSVLFSSGVLADVSPYTLFPETFDEYSVIPFSSRKLFTAVGSVAGYNWNFAAAVPFSSVTGTIFAVLTFFSVLLAVVFFASLVFTGRTTAAIDRDFRLLLEKIRSFPERSPAAVSGSGAGRPADKAPPAAGTDAVTSHPAGVPQPSPSVDEIVRLNDEFDRMASQIDTLIRQNYINEVLKKDAQLKLLESQLNPHFLYNTLDSIHWRAKAAGQDDIADITTSLAGLLRAALSNSDAPYYLRDELGLAEKYMTIQRMRYQSRLVYTVRVAESHLSCSVPKFILQPLLENAIRYGLEANPDKCSIFITSREDIPADGRRRLCIEVKNSGSLFEENLLEKLADGTVQPHGFGIGLRNIDSRIRIACGREYGLTLENEEASDDDYAVVRMTLPFHREGEEGC